jgi:UDPglucose 6-dehydrogenase
MKITVIGTGYVGLVTGACLAEQGNHVYCLDLNQEKIDILNAGGVPIYEPGLKEIIERNLAYGRLIFSTDVSAAVAYGDIQFIAVGTPPSEDGSADLSYVLEAARQIGRHMNRFKVVVNKSTVPVGTADKVTEVIAQELLNRSLPSENFSVISNPEFLKEGAAIEDFMRPDRIVIGSQANAAGFAAKEMMRQLYAPFNRHHERTYYMDVRSAELTKYAANAMLATRISFMNEIANLADVLGADIESVRQGIGSDTRIGYSFLYAGTGYGGSCFPKDVSALAKIAEHHGQELKLIKAVEEVNENQKNILVKKIIHRYGKDLAEKTFCLWGLAFKPNTDDMREAPSRVVIRNLLMRGARIKVHDPVAMHEARLAIHADMSDCAQLLEGLSFHEDPLDAAQGADALLIMTEWKSFRSPDFHALKQALATPVIFDGRNIYDPQLIIDQGFEYEGIGRKAFQEPSYLPELFTLKNQSMNHVSQIVSGAASGGLIKH